MCLLVAHSCLTLCDSTDCSPPGSSVCKILQARTLEWVAIPFFRGSSRPRDRAQVSCTAGGFFTTEPPGKPCFYSVLFLWPQGMWDLSSQPGIEPTPPALEGEVLAIGLPGKSLEFSYSPSLCPDITAEMTRAHSFPILSDCTSAGRSSCCWDGTDYMYSHSLHLFAFPTVCCSSKCSIILSRDCGLKVQSSGENNLITNNVCPSESWHVCR